MADLKQTRQKAIRAQCLECCNGNHAEVRKCHITDCSLWRYRLGHESKDASGERVTRGQAIKVKCIDCSGGIRSNVKSCTFTNCALFRYRP